MLPTTKTPAQTGLQEQVMLLYGPPKIGKSEFCSHAEGALFLATEPGLKHLEVFQEPIHDWEKLLAVCGELAKGEHPFKTIILDTIDNAYGFCADFICRKYNIEHPSDLPYSKGYGLVGNEFHRVLTKLAFLPYGLILVSHSQEREIESRTGKYRKTEPTLPNKARQVVLGLVNHILFCDFDQQKTPDGKNADRRVIRTRPSKNYEAGNHGGKLPDPIPLDYQAFLEAFRTADGPRDGANNDAASAPDEKSGSKK